MSKLDVSEPSGRCLSSFDSQWSRESNSTPSTSDAPRAHTLLIVGTCAAPAHHTQRRTLTPPHRPPRRLAATTGRRPTAAAAGRARDEAHHSRKHIPAAAQTATGLRRHAGGEGGGGGRDARGVADTLVEKPRVAWKRAAGLFGAKGRSFRREASK